MTAQVHFFNDFSEKDPHLNAVELCSRHGHIGGAIVKTAQNLLIMKSEQFNFKAQNMNLI